MIPKRRKYYIIICVPMQNSAPHLVMVASALSLAHKHTRMAKDDHKKQRPFIAERKQEAFDASTGRHYFALISLQFPSATTFAAVTPEHQLRSHTGTAQQPEDSANAAQCMHAIANIPVISI